MFRICLIDEENDMEGTVDGFLDDFLKDQKGIEYEFFYIDPTDKEMHEVIEMVIQLNVDIVFIDYILITYNGGEIISELNLKNPKLPKVVLTNDPKDFEESQIEFRAIDKEDMVTDNVNGRGTKLIELVVKSIEAYKKNLDDLKDEFDNLYEQVDNKTITPKNLERFLEIDEEITRTYGLDSGVNKNILKKTEIGELEEIINLAKKIINK